MPHRSPAQSTYEPYAFTTLAGGGGYSSNQAGTAARFWNPIAVAVDSAGNVYVAEQGNHSISKVTPAGAVTTLAGRPGSFGSSGGTGNAARFNTPSGAAVDSAGNVYVADTYNQTIRKVTPAGVVTTLAGLAGAEGSANGTGSAARFDHPFGVAVDSADNVYVADKDNHTIRKVTPGGVVTTLAGVAGSSGSADGTNSDARFNEPNSVTVDSAGNLYVAEWVNSTIRKMTLDGTNWVVTTAAGVAGSFGSANGTNNDARFNISAGVAVDSADNVYVADFANHLIRKMTLAGTNRVVTTLAGTGGIHGSAEGTGLDARFLNPSAVALDSAKNVYVADQINHTIRKVTSAGEVTTLAGLPGYGGSTDGVGKDAQFLNPSGVAVDSTANVYVADSVNCTIRRVTPAGEVTTLAGLAGTLGGDDGINSEARFIYPQGVAVDNAGNLYVADTFAYTIRKVTPVGTDWVVTTLAGLAESYGSQNGIGSAARFNAPTSVAVDSTGNVYVADTLNHLIRKVTPAGVVTTFAGGAGVVGSVDGTGTAARFYAPTGVAVDSADNVYVADTYNNTIRKITPARVVTTLGGMPGNIGTANGTGSAARFSNPAGLAVDSDGNVYVADFYFNTIRKGFPPLRLHSARFFADYFEFTYTGDPRQMIILEASADLLSWLPVGTNHLADVPIFRDRQSGVLSHRFYRARLP